MFKPVDSELYPYFE